MDPELSHPGESAANFSISNSPYNSQSANFPGAEQLFTVSSSTRFPEFTSSLSSQSPWTTSLLPSVEEIGDLSGTRPLSYFPTFNDRVDLQSPSGEVFIVGHKYYGLVSSLEISESQPNPEISNCLSFQPADRATHPGHLPSYPSGSFCTSHNYSSPAVTPFSLQGQASSESSRHTDIDDRGNTSTQEFSVASNPEGKDCRNSAALLYDLNNTDCTDSSIAQSLEPSALQLYDNSSDRVEVAPAENIDRYYGEIGPPRPVRKQGPLPCPVCRKGYSHQHELK